MNARFFSEDIPHNLGIGDVSISVSVEYEDSGERRLLFGDGEIFATKTEKAVPRIQAAALLSPEKGTFRIGIRLSDYVEGHSVRVLVIYFVVLPRSICEVGKNSAPDSVEELRRKQHENKFLFVIPVLAIMVGLLVQCVIAYNEYQKRYKDVMFEGAVGISSYIGEIINDLYEKGVDYDRMNGLPEYLAVKVEDSPLLWNVSVVNVYADTSDILTRSSEYNVSLKISGDDSSPARRNPSYCCVSCPVSDLQVSSTHSTVSCPLAPSLRRTPPATLRRSMPDFSEG